MAANRVYADITELVGRALAWLDAIPPKECLRRTGVTSSKFEWLPTLVHHLLSVQCDGL